jgi:hypothetical protein
MATEQQFYEMLTRIDHPVFPKDMSTVTDSNSPFNSVMNRLRARQFVKLQAAINSLSGNSFPQTCDENTIDRWEETYFGFTKPDLLLVDRKAALLIKINRRLTMSAPDVLALAQSITGQTPELTRSLWKSGWIIGTSIIGKNTYIASGTDNSHSAVYVLRFLTSVDSALIKLLDSILTQIEKGGSRHSIIVP